VWTIRDEFHEAGHRGHESHDRCGAVHRVHVTLRCPAIRGMATWALELIAVSTATKRGLKRCKLGPYCRRRLSK